MIKKIALIVSIIFLFFTTSCSSLKNDATLLAEPTKLENNYSQLSSEFQGFLDKLGAFSCDLSAQFYNYYETDDNIAISPISIYMALSLAMECSNNNTRLELEKAVGISYEEVKTNMKLLLSKLEKEINIDNKLKTKLDITNSIWVQDDLNVLDKTINSLADNYCCYPYKTDFYTNNKNANKAVREFVKEQTNDLIDYDFNISKDAVLCLINTLYLKDIWDIDDDLSFMPNKYKFININNQTKDVNLLKGHYNLGQIYEAETFSHFYTTTSAGYKLKFILPKDGYSIKDIFNTENINAINNISNYNSIDESKREQYFTRCLFPEFKASSDKVINDLLTNKYQINDLFTNECDFTNITDSTFSSNREIDYIYCDRVIHVCELEVNKKGIEGAAVTAMIMDGATSEPIYKNVYNDFIIDKSFGYIITDINDVVLFSGVINNV